MFVVHRARVLKDFTFIETIIKIDTHLVGIKKFNLKFLF